MNSRSVKIGWKPHPGLGLLVTRLEKFAEIVTKWGTVGSAVCIFLMMAAGVVDIFSSQILRTPVHLAYEIVALSLVGATWLAVGQAQLQSRHIAITFLVSRLSRKSHKITKLTSYCLGMLAGIGICWISWPVTLHSIATKEIVSHGFPVTVVPSRICLMAGAVLFALACFTQTVRSFIELLVCEQRKPEALSRTQ